MTSKKLILKLYLIQWLNKQTRLQCIHCMTNINATVCKTKTCRFYTVHQFITSLLYECYHSNYMYIWKSVNGRNYLRNETLSDIWNLYFAITKIDWVWHNFEKRRIPGNNYPSLLLRFGVLGFGSFLSLSLATDSPHPFCFFLLSVSRLHDLHRRFWYVMPWCTIQNVTIKCYVIHDTKHCSTIATLPEFTV